MGSFIIYRKLELIENDLNTHGYRKLELIETGL